MPSIARVVDKFAKQKMVLWSKIGNDPNGRPIYATPTEVFIRWEECFRQRVDAAGRLYHSTAMLLLAVPMKVGDLVFLGTLATWQAMPTYPALPTVNQGGQEIKQVDTTPDLKAQSYIYQAYI